MNKLSTILLSVLFSFDKEGMENHTMRRLALNEGDGTHHPFGEEKLKKLVKSNQRITRKGIAECFGFSPRSIQRYMNQVKSLRYVGSGKSRCW